MGEALTAGSRCLYGIPISQAHAKGSNPDGITGSACASGAGAAIARHERLRRMSKVKSVIFMGSDRDISDVGLWEVRAVNPGSRLDG